MLGAQGRGGSVFLIATVVWLQISGKETSDKTVMMAPLVSPCSSRAPPPWAVPLALSRAGATLLQLQSCAHQKKMESHVHSSAQTAFTELDLDRFPLSLSHQEEFLRLEVPAAFSPLPASEGDASTMGHQHNC